MLTKLSVVSLVVGLIALVLLGPWMYHMVQASNRKMEQVETLMDPTPQDVIVREPEPAVATMAPTSAPVPQVPVVDAKPEPTAVPEEPSHIYTSECAPQVPMQSSRRGGNLHFGWADQAGVYPCSQKDMDHTAPKPLAPGRYELPYGTVTVLPHQ